MNAKYLRAQATASRLIKANGAKFQMSRVVPGVVDEVEGSIGAATTQTQDIFAVILPPSGNLDRFKGEGGVLDLDGLRKILISKEGLQWNPEPLQRVLYRGEWWLYEESMELGPDGETDILFKGYLRKA